MGYTGNFTHNLDAKNRIFIPAKFREALGSSFYIFKSTETCIYIYDEAGWQDTISGLINESDTPEGRKKQRLVFRRVVSVDMDKQGRITLPNEFVEHAGLTKDVVISGMGKRIEVWDAEKWNELEDEDASVLDTGINY